MSPFGLSVPQMSMVCNETLTLCATSGEICCINSANPESFPQAIQERRSPIKQLFCWGGVADGTVRRVCRQGKNQQVLYNGQEKVLAIKFQSAATVNS